MRISKNLLLAYNGYFYFSYKYPRWLRQLNTSLTISFRMSLKTKDLSVAEFLVKVFLIVIDKVLMMIREDYLMGKPSELNIHDILNMYRDYISEAHPITQREVCWGEEGFEEVVEYTRNQIMLLRQWKLLDYLDVREFSNLDQLYERALEANEAKQEVDIERTVQTIIEDVPAIEETSKTVEKRDPISKITISELFEEYTGKKVQEGSWKSKTALTNRYRIEALIECIGDKNVSECTKADARDFLSYLENRTYNSKNKSTSISKMTINQFLETVNVLFKFGVNRHDGIDHNYFDNSDLKIKIQKRDKKERQNWTDEELIKMFTHQIYQEKQTIKHPYCYWLPILSLCTGARLNELCSLQVLDVREDNEVHYLSINLDQPEKSIKTKEERVIPIHQCLIDLGFLKMIELMKNPEYQFIDEQGHCRIWRGTCFDEQNESYTKNVSGWFNNKKPCPKREHKPEGSFKGFKYQHGFEFPDKQMKDFHSFRHSFVTIAHQQNMDRATVFQITGHSDGENKRTVGDGYNHGKELEMLNETIQKIDFAKLLVGVKPFFEIYPKNILKAKVKTKNKK